MRRKGFAYAAREFALNSAAAAEHVALLRLPRSVKGSVASGVIAIRKDLKCLPPDLTQNRAAKMLERLPAKTVQRVVGN